jgi:hypothetical protein
MPKLEMEPTPTKNPAAKTARHHEFPIQAPASAVVKKQDPKHTKADYKGDLGKASQRVTREINAEPKTAERLRKGLRQMREGDVIWEDDDPTNTA